ncbi:hypothetical protein J6590_076103 [Homalodisca vitripennis]|nr:hypothetical protein J6590_076103 [Homalodisca vitripennis]
MVFASLDITVLYSLRTLTGEAGSELVSPSFRGNMSEINTLNSSSWISTGGDTYPQPYPYRISSHSGSSTKVPGIDYKSWSPVYSIYSAFDSDLPLEANKSRRRQIVTLLSD